MRFDFHNSSIGIDLIFTGKFAMDNLAELHPYFTRLEGVDKVLHRSCIIFFMAYVHTSISDYAAKPTSIC
jgi:hypothetical protein